MSELFFITKKHSTGGFKYNISHGHLPTRRCYHIPKNYLVNNHNNDKFMRTGNSPIAAAILISICGVFSYVGNICHLKHVKQISEEKQTTTKKLQTSRFVQHASTDSSPGDSSKCNIWDRSCELRDVLCQFGVLIMSRKLTF